MWGVEGRGGEAQNWEFGLHQVTCGMPIRTSKWMTKRQHWAKAKSSLLFSQFSPLWKQNTPREDFKDTGELLHISFQNSEANFSTGWVYCIAHLFQSLIPQGKNTLVLLGFRPLVNPKGYGLLIATDSCMRPNSTNQCQSFSHRNVSVERELRGHEVENLILILFVKKLKSAGADEDTGAVHISPKV